MKFELICAMLHEPELIFLDEPTIGLDILAKEAIRSFIKQINIDKGTTFIVTMHDMSDIEDLCDRVTVINHGAIEQVIKEIYGRKAVWCCNLHEIRMSWCQSYRLPQFFFFLIYSENSG
jgi:ABC-type uncharacterized transport system ATPase subunit